MKNCDYVKCHKEDVPSISEEFHKRLWPDLGGSHSEEVEWGRSGSQEESTRRYKLYGFELCKPCLPFLPLCLFLSEKEVTNRKPGFSGGSGLSAGGCDPQRREGSSGFPPTLPPIHYTEMMHHSGVTNKIENVTLAKWCQLGRGFFRDLNRPRNQLSLPIFSWCPFSAAWKRDEPSNLGQLPRFKSLLCHFPSWDLGILHPLSLSFIISGM